MDPLFSETFGANADPDDLAALVCAALKRAGKLPTVAFHTEVLSGENLAQWKKRYGYALGFAASRSDAPLRIATAIEIYVRGLLVASFPIGPIEIGPDSAGFDLALKAIEGK